MPNEFSAISACKSLRCNDKRTRFYSFSTCLTRLVVMPNRYAYASATSFGIGCGNRTTRSIHALPIASISKQWGRWLHRLVRSLTRAKDRHPPRRIYYSATRVLQTKSVFRHNNDCFLLHRSRRDAMLAFSKKHRKAFSTIAPSDSCRPFRPSL